jgi:hypothetical protein
MMALVLIALMGTAILPASPVQANGVWYVATTGDDISGDGSLGLPWKTIQHAVDNVTAGATISVADGTYSNAATGEVFPIQVNKANLTIVSSGTAANTIISPTSNDRSAFEVTAAGVAIGGSGFTITAGGRAGIYADVTGGNELTVQDCIFKSYGDGESRGMWFEKLWNGALITSNSFATPKCGTGIVVVNADGATISNNRVEAGTVKYCFLTFKAEAFYPLRDPTVPYTEYVATSPSTINNVLVTDNSITGIGSTGKSYWGIRFGASTKGCDHGCPQAQDLTVGAGGVTISGNTFTNNNGTGVKIDADTAGPNCGGCIPADATAHIYGVSNVTIKNNNFSGNTVKAVDNGQPTTVDATNNWWGDNSGPSGGVADPVTGAIANGSGDAVSANVRFDPWTGKSTPASTSSATGTGTVTFTPSNGSITGLTAVAEGTLPVAGKPGVSFPHGLFSFNIVGLAPGSTVTITITLPSSVPAGTQYWKCQNGAWVNVTSLLGDNDGDNVLTLTLTDGGLGDADGIANGTIVDPGGPGVPVGAPIPSKPRASATPPHPILNPAQISVRYLNISPQQTSAGQPVTISTNVVNGGDQAGNYNVALKINGQVEQQKMVSVSPQGTQPVKFTVTKAQPGTYTVAIDGQKANFTVLGSSSSSGTTGSKTGALIALALIGILIIATLVALLLRRT